MSVSASQSSHNPGSAPGHGPRSESPQPLSADDTATRQMSGASYLPKLPEDVQIPPTIAQVPRSDYRSSSGRHRQSELDYIVPMEPKREPRPKNYEQRIRPTLTHAQLERERCQQKARLTGYALNIAIGLQVGLGALTTGLSAVTSGRQTSIATSILGGMSTLVASYLARARGSNEPELSITRVHDLDQYIRECEIFILDYGHMTGNEHDSKLTALRDNFEELLGNGNGERRLASV